MLTGGYYLCMLYRTDLETTHTGMAWQDRLPLPQTQIHFTYKLCSSCRNVPKTQAEKQTSAGRHDAGAQPRWQPYQKAGSKKSKWCKHLATQGGSHKYWPLSSKLRSSTKVSHTLLLITWSQKAASGQSEGEVFHYLNKLQPLEDGTFSRIRI